MADTLDITSYSDREQTAINELIDNNNEFYNSLNIADIPFSDIVTTDDNGIVSVIPFVSTSITSNGNEYKVTLKNSEEQKCWFITIEYGDDSYTGIVHYNCVMNCFGTSAFMILNSNEGATYDDITNTLCYANFLILEK